jgi:hypothetical protein
MVSRKQDPSPPSDWCVLVEETTGGGDSQRWGLTVVFECETREDAVAKAIELTAGYSPRHPSIERERKVYRVGEDIWVVWVGGATREYHFRLSIARPGAQ